nr:possible membrane protein [Kibdelosporangium sp. MJ126-NF4]
MGIIASALVALSVLTGLFAALSLQSKQDTISGLVEHREPLSAAAQQIYRSLSDADATASSAFLSGGSEPAPLRERYEVDMAQAGAALAKAASDIGGIAEAEKQVDTLGQQLPVYAGLIETARSNNRFGLPIGAAYLREASTLMRTELLPAAQELYRIDIGRLTDEQDDAASFPWLTVALTLILLGSLIATQVYLTRRTNRLINVGLLVSTIAVGVGLLWGAAAGWVSASAVGDARDEGSQQVDVLVQARIVALKCRADETLTLVARGDGAAYEKEWQELAPTIAGKGNDDKDLLVRAQKAAGDPAIGQQVRGAIDNAQAWQEAHKKVRELDDGGQYDQAVDMAVGGDDKDAATAFNRLDEHLSSAIQKGREKFVDATTSAGNALIGLVPGVVLLSLVGAGGALVGIRQRLREYR